MIVSGRTRYVCLLCFADNYWLVATSPSELEEANSYWQGLLLSAGWHTPIDELKYATTASDTDFTHDIYFNGEVIKRVPRGEGFKALGTQITFVTRHDVEFERRIKAAWASFGKNSAALCCKSAPLKQRLKFLDLVVNPALFWCSGSWNLRVDQFVRLRGIQRKMIRKMMCFKKYDTEDLARFMQRTESMISNIIDRHNVISWDTLARRFIFRWAGWVARLEHHDPQRITLAVLRHKNWDWISLIASQNRGRQLHGRYLHTWRWEKLLYKFAEENFPGQKWSDLALDASSWIAIVNTVC